MKLRLRSPAPRRAPSLDGSSASATSFRRLRKRHPPTPPRPRSKRTVVDDYDDSAAPVRGPYLSDDDDIERAAAAAAFAAVAGLSDDDFRAARPRTREEGPFPVPRPVVPTTADYDGSSWGAAGPSASWTLSRGGTFETDAAGGLDGCCGEAADLVGDAWDSLRDVLTVWRIRDRELSGLLGELRRARVVPRTRRVAPRVPLLRDHTVCGRRVVVYV